MADGNRHTAETTRIETVTPELAAEWLKSNTANRAVIIKQVEALAEAIKRGEWRVTHQGIAFAVDGSLLDGQHRLHAVVKAGVAVQMRVTRGLPLDTRDAIDTGTTRRAADVLAIADGIHVGTNKRAVILAARALVLTSTVNTNRRTDVRALREALADHGESYDVINKIFGGSHDRLAQAPLMGALCVSHRVYPETTEEFARLLRDPSGLHNDSPVVALRDYALLTYAPNTSEMRTGLAGRTFSAIVAFRGGKSRQFVRPGSALTAGIIDAWREKMGREVNGAE